MVAADGLPQVGSKVRLNASTWNGPTVVEGVLLAPSAEGCITVKLLNGYNVTHRLENVTELEVVAGPDAESTGDEGEVVEDAGLPVVFILHTGGTIASKVDYSTGAVTARFEPEELLAAVPELARHARIRTRKLGNMWSDDIRPRHWNRMASASAEAFAEGAAGVVITHGTDTMHISAAAVAFAFSGEGGRPAGRIAFTGSQRSSDRGSTDGVQNLIAAVHWAAHGPEPAGGCADSTTLIMHAGSDDGLMSVHPGCAVRKDHSSRRDAFQSVNQAPLAEVAVSQDGAEITLDEGYAARRQQATAREVCESPTPFSEDVRILQLIAGSQLYADQIEFAGSAGYDAILFHGTGLGHLPLDDPGDAPENTAVADALGVYVAGGGVAVVTTQCIRGPIHLDVYSKGRDQQDLGVLGHGSTCSPEASLAKLHHLLSRGVSGDELAAAWKADLVGENPDTI
ncbi:MAG: Glu-tRNA(Gln) amidotransferase subunit GatD [Candidatus Poseidoniales archaeon]|nr:Glu-tRNA(Gln) amidotransferase subunit GatD [Candidatus Poseidoniales archaeon]